MGVLLFGVEGQGFPNSKRCLQTLASAGREANGPSLYQLPTCL